MFAFDASLPDRPIEMETIKIYQTQSFTKDSLEALLPVILYLTRTAKSRYEHFESQLLSSNRGGKKIDVLDDFEVQLEAVLARWQKKIIALGGSPKGLWIADFDAGTGYFCWKYPENKIEYWHGYGDGFTQRVQIESLHAHRTCSTQSDTWSV